MIAKKTVRCAIYTRKSTEEGLEQEFNSLDAQRDSCDAYVASQKSEGWNALRNHYDDGGYSGGTLDRPGLLQLLADIEAGQIDVVVVYKIDRLTRSLMDFAKLVEVFDRKAVTFVSVTQSFNTTTSMGRLTLNVLLSFAQFEREVTGERIRDKIAASKRKGMWMGGTPPLGYDVVDRKLVINAEEAKTVRWIFQRYRELGSVRALGEELEKMGIRSKSWTSMTGRRHAGVAFSRGSLYHLLKNQILVGRITYKSEHHPGEHEAIISPELFEAVQNQIAENRKHELGKKNASQNALLTGILFDQDGALMSPHYSVNPVGARYRYYISPEIPAVPSSKIHRVPAISLESVIIATLDRLKLITESATTSPDKTARELLIRVALSHRSIVIHLNTTKALETWRSGDPALANFEDTDVVRHHRSFLLVGEIIDIDKERIRLVLPIRAKFRGGQASVVQPAGTKADISWPDTVLIDALKKAHLWKQMLLNGEVDSINELATRFDYDRRDAGRLFTLISLGPAATREILEGRQPSDLRLQHLLDHFVPLSWQEQSVLSKITGHH